MTSIMKDSQCGTYNYMAPEAIKSASPAGTNHEYKVNWNFVSRNLMIVNVTFWTCRLVGKQMYGP
jgi:hypothetical protein